MAIRFFKQYVLGILLTTASLTSYAAVSSVLVLNGRTVRCESNLDLGQRAFTLGVESIADMKLVLKLDTFVCSAIDEQFILKPQSLATHVEYQVGQDLITYHIEGASVAVTNIDGTVEIAKFAIDSGKSSQTLVVDINFLSGMKVDMTIVGLEVIKKNGQVDDQGLSFGGHFRVINLK